VILKMEIMDQIWIGVIWVIQEWKDMTIMEWMDLTLMEVDHKIMKRMDGPTLLLNMDSKILMEWDQTLMELELTLQ